jgi:hypothetical protein
VSVHLYIHLFPKPADIWMMFLFLFPYKKESTLQWTSVSTVFNSEVCYDKVILTLHY